MERDVSELEHAPRCRHFNSHAHVERDSYHSPCVVKQMISTHTLTWSVTVGGFAGFDFFKISTHTLTWSVTVRMCNT